MDQNDDAIVNLISARKARSMVMCNGIHNAGVVDEEMLLKHKIRFNDELNVWTKDCVARNDWIRAFGLVVDPEMNLATHMRLMKEIHKAGYYSKYHNHRVIGIIVGRFEFYAYWLLLGLAAIFAIVGTAITGLLYDKSHAAVGKVTPMCQAAAIFTVAAVIFILVCHVVFTAQLHVRFERSEWRNKMQS